MRGRPEQDEKAVHAEDRPCSRVTGVREEAITQGVEQQPQRNVGCNRGVDEISQHTKKDK